jgi:hypothetical protein
VDRASKEVLDYVIGMVPRGGSESGRLVPPSRARAVLRRTSHAVSVKSV